MKKRWISLLFGLSLYAMPVSASAYTMDDVPTDKMFTITFSDEVNVQTLQEDAIIVEDAQGNVVQGVSFALHEQQQQEVFVIAPVEQYEPNSSYTLTIHETVESADGTALQQTTTMDFTTASEANTFEARPNSPNEVVYEDNATVLPSSVQADYEPNNQQFTITEPVELQANDIVIFPPTEEAPNGFAKKVVSVKTSDGNTIIETTEPTYEEVVKNIDISQEVAITTDDFKIAGDAAQRVVFSKNQEHVIKNEDGTKGLIKFDEFKDTYGNVVGTTVYFENIKYDLLNTGKYNSLTGDLRLVNPKLALDVTTGSVNEIRLTSNFNVNIDKTLTLAEAKWEKKRLPLPVEVPVKIAGAVGGSIIPYFELSAKGELTLGFDVNVETNLNIGFVRTDDGWKGFNRSTFDASPTLHALKAEAEAKLAVGLAIQAEFLQFAIGGMEGAMYGKVNASGDLTCYNVTAYGGVHVSGFIGKHENPLMYLKAIDLEGSIGKAVTCELRSIEADDLTINVGKSKKLAVTGKKLTLEDIQITLPDNSVSLKTSDPTVATVTKNGQVKVPTTAKHGDTATITIAYTNVVGKSVQTSVKVTVNDPLYVKPVEPQQPTEPTKPVEPSTPIEVNKTYTIEEWGLTFELPEAVTNYTIEENYGYHIYNEEGHPMVYLYQYNKGADPSFRGYWSQLPSDAKYDYYIQSGFNIFFDDENSPYYDEQATVFNSIVESAKLIK